MVSKAIKLNQTFIIYLTGYFFDSGFSDGCYSTSLCNVSSTSNLQQVYCMPPAPPPPPPRSLKEININPSVTKLNNNEADSINIAELKNLFVGEKKNKPNKENNVTKKSVISQNRCLQIAIFIRNVNIDAILKAIDHFETENIDLDILQHLDIPKPLSSEVEMIVKSKHLIVEVKNNPDMVLKKVLEISDYSKKIDLLVFYANLQESSDIILKNTNEIIGLCHFLIEEKNLTILFSIIKTCLDNIRENSLKKGIVASLWTLKGIKSTDKKTSLLEYIVKSYINAVQKQSPNTKLYSPMPEINALKRASSIDLQLTKSQILKLEANIQGKPYHLNTKSLF